MKALRITGGGLLFIALVLGYFTRSGVDYIISAKGVILPQKEWVLSRTIEGNLISSFQDNVTATTNTFNVTEFSRGDVVEFRLNQDVMNKQYIQAGDTIGYIYSNEEERKLKQLSGELEVLFAQLEYYTTGQKPEDVSVAKEKLNHAIQDYETQKLLYERNFKLHQDSVISTQDFEISYNTFKLKEFQREIAKAELESSITGDKPEQEGLIQSRIRMVENQISQIQDRINFFTIVSPIEGLVMKSSNQKSENMLFKVLDTSNFVVLTPIEFFERKYLQVGNQIRVKSRIFNENQGELLSLDNTVQIVNAKQAFYTTSVIENTQDLVLGELVDVEINGGKVTLMEYIARVFDVNI